VENEKRLITQENEGLRTGKARAKKRAEQGPLRHSAESDLATRPLPTDDAAIGVLYAAGDGCARQCQDLRDHSFSPIFRAIAPTGPAELESSLRDLCRLRVYREPKRWAKVGRSSGFAEIAAETGQAPSTKELGATG
jgi:hypothetical protein